MTGMRHASRRSRGCTSWPGRPPEPRDSSSLADCGGRCPVVTDARVPRRDPVNMMSPPDHDRHDRHVLPLSARIDLRSRGSWGAGDLYRWASRWTFAWVAPVIVVTLVCPAAVLDRKSTRLN